MFTVFRSIAIILRSTTAQKTELELSTDEDIKTTLFLEIEI